MIHLEGTIVIYDGVEFRENVGISIADLINQEIYKCQINHSESITKPSNEYSLEFSTYIPNVSFRAYFSDNKCTLEDAENNQILASIGGLDLLQEWYGYSEWTIMGYDTVSFKLINEKDGGEHDLENILENYEGKYIHILIDIL